MISYEIPCYAYVNKFKSRTRAYKKSQLEEFNKSKSMVDATLHPSYQENLTKLKDIIYERSQLESG